MAARWTTTSTAITTWWPSSFFERLFGAGKHARTPMPTPGAVERGLYVVIVEGRDQLEADRAQGVMHGMEARDVNLVQRAGERTARRGCRTPARTRESVAGLGSVRKLEVVDDDKPIASPDLDVPRDKDRPL